MYNKEYRDYLNVLRAREVRPPIEQMARLIAAAPARPSFTIPLFARFLSALAIGGMVAVGYWALSARFPAADAPKSTFANAKSALPLANKSHGTHASRVSANDRAISTEPIFTEPEGSVLHSTDADNTNALLTAFAIPRQAIPFHRIGADLHSFSPIPIPIPNSEKEMERNFFATVGGALSQQFSSNVSYRRTSFSDAFLALGYSLSQNSSVRILAGEETFNMPSTTTTNSISFHDTTFVHDGQTYQNVLGELQSANIPILTRAYWLGASYRYTLGDAATAIRPFAEVMAGGSTDGFLTHQSLGAEFSAASSIDLDLLFEASELLPQNSGWLTKAGFAAALSYRW